ncbi:hypothetical protein KGF54_005519 [Candida jiufengensis]|uniref:uncharacterized protein n=1 Tax=Candida jiufengensis TaxID=497108 RepID=UPI0022252240|nr:uncharacterized protein KGF54_005519 [Candida jiufengensis]KAI5949284.1 hypothetical protein KGF54_005519 [Candida jiufengensis]
MSLSRSSSLSQSNPNAPKTSIIISNLHKDDFIKLSKEKEPKLITKSLSLVDQIKLSVLNKDDSIIQYINHWSNLPFLNRIIIIFKNEIKAKEILNFLQLELKPFTYIKLSLQENLLTRSKSQDTLLEKDNSNLNVSISLDNFRNFHNDPKNETKQFDYIEPEPAQFNVLSDLSKLGINLRDFNSDEQLNELKQEEQEDQIRANNRRNSMSPTIPSNHIFQNPNNNNNSPIQQPSSPVSSLSSSLGHPGIERRRSTKTLFKPDLKLNTNSGSNSSIDEKSDDIIINKNQNTPILKLSPTKNDEFPASPTITLDETF